MRSKTIERIPAGLARAGKHELAMIRIKCDMHIEAGNQLAVACSIRYSDRNVLGGEGMVNQSTVIVQDCDLFEADLSASFAVFPFSYSNQLTGSCSRCILFQHRARIPWRNQLSAF